MKRRNKLILEFTEFNLQRFNDTSAQASVHVDDPQLSLNAFDKHLDGLRAAMSRINDIMGRLSDTGAYRNLRSKMALENQNIKNLNILRIVKVNNISYDAYISFEIGDDKYWGVAQNLMSNSTDLKSEVFKDYDLFQSKEWIIKTKGLIIKTLKEWLKPEPGTYRLLNEEVVCYSVETGKQLSMERGLEIELVRAHTDRLVISHDDYTYNLIGDNYVFFNWWFEKID
jgi:hypothetical protein